MAPPASDRDPADRVGARAGWNPKCEKIIKAKNALPARGGESDTNQPTGRAEPVAFSLIYVYLLTHTADFFDLIYSFVFRSAGRLYNTQLCCVYKRIKSSQAVRYGSKTENVYSVLSCLYKRVILENRLVS